jgi:pSer/pThr/pTyr-binding forkhead associated (FHA) protein
MNGFLSSPTVRLSNLLLNPSMCSHLLIVEDDQGQWELLLEEPIYSIGRDPKCDIRLVSQFVSRRHATLVQFPNEDGLSYYYRIVDGNLRGKLSANGLLVNGQKLPARDLKNGDEIVFASKIKIIYYLIDQEQSALTDVEQTTISHPFSARVLPEPEAEAGEEHPTYRGPRR